ncbi:MAG TPA: hypothetical protein PLB89_16915 [Flavobacteriales bacterium]|nr:hypothetical protein [Flavobacteriales bacterium]
MSMNGEQGTTTGEDRSSTVLWTLLAIGWALVLCFLLDPKPLAAPGWAISLLRSSLDIAEPVARIIAAALVRLGGVGILGLLVMVASGERAFTRRSFLFLVLIPVLALVTMWVNYRYFPIVAQMKLIVIAALCGALAALMLRRSWKATAALVLLLGALYLHLTGYTVDDELDSATRAQVKQMLANSSVIAKGDAGFLQLTEQAFTFASTRTRGSDPVLQNKAAVLGLALVLGHEKLAGLADRHIDPRTQPACDSLRARLTIHDRPDWVRHFCVSAGLTVMEHDDRSMAVGIVKELKDANPGGSGFSFGDLTADAAGNLFALSATRDTEAALTMQERMRSGPVITDLFPDVHDLPEGLTAEEFTSRFGGVGGAGTDSLVQVILQRLDNCAALR